MQGRAKKADRRTNPVDAGGAANNQTLSPLAQIHATFATWDQPTTWFSPTPTGSSPGQNRFFGTAKKIVDDEARSLSWMLCLHWSCFEVLRWWRLWLGVACVVYQYFRPRSARCCVLDRWPRGSVDVCVRLELYGERENDALRASSQRGAGRDEPVFWGYVNSGKECAISPYRDQPPRPVLTGLWRTGTLWT